MNRKIVVIFVEAIIVLLFLLAVYFFYGFKMAEVSVTDYENQTARMSVLLSKSVALAKKTNQSNITLKSQVTEFSRSVQNLETENSALKAQVAALQGDVERFKVNAETVTPLKERIKAIMAQLDSLNLSSARKEELDSQLRAIYEEVNSLDLNIARLAKNEPLYKEVARNRENTLKEKVEEAQKILMQNYQLNEKVTAYTAQVKELNDKLTLLENEKNANFAKTKDKEKQVVDYESRLSQLQKERESETQELVKQKEEAARLNETLAGLQKEKESLFSQKSDIERKISGFNKSAQSDRDRMDTLKTDMARLKTEYNIANSQYVSLQSKISESENILSKRATRIVVLEDSLNKKTSTIAKLKEDMKARIKELADLRNSMVKVKIENARLKAAIAQKESAFNNLKQEISTITKTNAQFTQTLSKAQEAFGAQAPASPADKAVNVEIKSVDTQEEADAPGN